MVEVDEISQPSPPNDQILVENIQKVNQARTITVQDYKVAIDKSTFKFTAKFIKEVPNKPFFALEPETPMDFVRKFN